MKIVGGHAHVDSSVHCDTNSFLKVRCDPVEVMEFFHVLPVADDHSVKFQFFPKKLT